MSTTDTNMRFTNRATLDKFYRNSRNNIEDPIFTGFTFDIDIKHSPLFYALCGDEYNESLRSPEGTDTTLAKKIEDKLTEIYKYFVIGEPDTYGIRTLFSKDEFGGGNERRPGYGLQSKVYLDDVIYGAVDYIYMVDKIVDGLYSDDAGVTDIGNGTPTSSIYVKYNEELSDLNSDKIQQKVNDNTSIHDVNIFFNCDKDDIRSDQEAVADEMVNLMKSVSDSVAKLSGYASKDDAGLEHNMDLSRRRVERVRNYLTGKGVDGSRISTTYYGDTRQPFTENIKNRAVTCELDGNFNDKKDEVLRLKIAQENAALTENMSATDERDENPLIKEHNKNLDTLNSIQAENSDYSKNKKEYDEKKEELKKLDNNIEVQKQNVRAKYAEFSDNAEKYLNKLKANTESEVKTSIDSLYTDFEKYIDDLNNSNSNIKVDISVVKKDDTTKFEKELKELKEYEDKNREYYQKCWAIIKTSIRGIGVNEKANESRQRLQNEIEQLSGKLFGIHEDGRLGTEDNPASPSLAYDLQQAKLAVINDTYSQQEYRKNELNNLLTDYSDLVKYNKINDDRGKTEIVRLDPTADYEKKEGESNEDYNKRISEPKYEVPQTVYDMMGFINGMKDITNKYPYALQSITGLDEAYKKYFEVKDPYLGSGDDTITIECLDYLDMRVSSMFNKYFNAVYDRQYRRERVPINLRRFNCSIFVHDIRNFKNSLNGGKYPGGGDLKALAEIALNHVSAIEFKFYDCEFIPEETGSIFENVSNVTYNDPVKTKFTFRYGNCIINFLPFEDLRKYLLQADINNIKPKVFTETVGSSTNDDKKFTSYADEGVDDGNTRRWFDKSVLGNVGNNDYRDYIRHDSSVAVDDHFKTTIVNNFAMNSVVNKNQELTEMDDALRKIVVGISASTGIPVKGVTDALNIGFIDPILNEQDLATPVVKSIGNVNNSKVIDENTMEYIGTVMDETKEKMEFIDFLGNVNEEKKDGK